MHQSELKNELCHHTKNTYKDVNVHNSEPIYSSGETPLNFKTKKTISRRALYFKLYVREHIRVCSLGSATVVSKKMFDWLKFWD